MSINSFRQHRSIKSIFFYFYRQPQAAKQLMTIFGPESTSTRIDPLMNESYLRPPSPVLSSNDPDATPGPVEPLLPLSSL